MSCKITTLAEVRLMPRPPARVDNRNTNMSGSVLNSSINTILQNKDIYTVTCDTLYAMLIKMISKCCLDCLIFDVTIFHCELTARVIEMLDSLIQIRTMCDSYVAK